MTLQRFIAPQWIPFRNMGCHPWQDKWQPKPINFFFFLQHSGSCYLIYCTFPPPFISSPCIESSNLQSLDLTAVWRNLNNQSPSTLYFSLNTLSMSDLSNPWTTPCLGLCDVATTFFTTQSCMQVVFIDANILFKGILRFEEHNQISVAHWWHIGRFV